MTLEIAGEIGRISLIGVIRQIYLAEASGVLEVTRGDQKRRFFVRDGELYLPGSHFLGQRLGTLLELERELQASREMRPNGAAREGLRSALKDQERDPKKSEQAREQLQELVARIVDVLVEWQTGRYELLRVPLPTDPPLVGPLPTAYLVMEGSSRELDLERGLEELGGVNALIVADSEARVLKTPYGIDPDEMFLLTRAETATTVGELLRQLPGDRNQGIRKILRLASVDVLRPTSMPDQPADRSLDHQYSQSMAERFQLRFASQLPDSDVPADEEEREFVRGLLGRFAGLDYYEILGVLPDATSQSIYDAFQDLARRVHPGNAKRLGMPKAAPALSLLFERATAAYLVLGDKERRAEYNAEAGIEMSRAISSGERAGEQKKVAMMNARRAERLLLTGEYHFALELARQAVRADPQAEYIALLGQVQRHNPNWIPDAIENLKQAIRMDPKTAKYRFELGELMEEAGYPERAAVHYQATLQLAPGDGDAMEALERVRGSSADGEGEQSFIGRIKGIWTDGGSE